MTILLSKQKALELGIVISAAWIIEVFERINSQGAQESFTKQMC